MGYLRNDDNFINADDGQRINGERINGGRINGGRINGQHINGQRINDVPILEEINEDAEQIDIINAAEETDNPISDNTYYIGLPGLSEGHYLYLLHIKANNYFRFDHDDVDEYLRTFSYMDIPDEQPIEIFKTQYTFEEIGGERVHNARVVLKTCWLRIFQRKWRRLRQKQQ
jgi:hypothetical protein